MGIPQIEESDAVKRDPPVCPSSEWARDFVASWTADRMSRGLGPVQSMPDFIDMSEAAYWSCPALSGDVSKTKGGKSP